MSKIVENIKELDSKKADLEKILESLKNCEEKFWQVVGSSLELSSPLERVTSEVQKCEHYL